MNTPTPPNGQPSRACGTNSPHPPQWGTGETGTTQFGSRPVISTGTVALIIEITEAALEAAVELVGQTRGNTPDNLSATTAHLKDTDQIGWWTDQLRTWVNQARTQLHLDPPNSRSARGATCPACGETTAYLKQGPKEYVRTPALAIIWNQPEGDDYHPDTDWRVGAVECRGCAMAWARGETLHTLIDMMLHQQTRETMTG